MPQASADVQTVTIPYGAFDPNFNTAAPQWYLPAAITILSNQTAYADNGDDVQVTLPLDNSSPVNFQIQLQGSGLPKTDPS